MAKKKLNTRCPLQAECERKCAYEGHELDCDYYFNNAVGEGRTIGDQELIRAERERKDYEDAYNAELSVPDENERDFGQLRYIDISDLYPHPDNPRMDVGDVTELAESIKAKGILQNLTVVPGHYVKYGEWTAEGYTVIIGHRRLAGAKLAGLSELPCSVVDMSTEDQLATMLVENMQRSDLTVYEEAKGFQMMLDLGKSVKEVSEMSGFSESTVRKRVKLAELDEAKFKKAVDRGATLFDFAELDKIDDSDVKNKLLDSMGKPDFRNNLRKAIDDQTRVSKVRDFAAQIKEWATQIEDVQYESGKRVASIDGANIELRYATNFGWWASNGTSAEMPPDGYAESRLFYKVSPNQVDIYCEVTDAERQSELEQKAEEQRKQDKRVAEKQRFINITARHYQLRREFILDFNQFKQKSSEIAEFVSDSMIARHARDCYARAEIDSLSELLGVPLNNSKDNLDYHEYLRIKREQPERTMLLIAFWMRDSKGNGYWDSRWDCSTREYVNVFDDNEFLDETYRLLELLGYKKSDEEDQMREGTHPIFSEAASDEDEVDT